MYCNIVFMIDIFVISKITQYRYYVIAITDVRSLGLSTKWRTLMIKKTMKVRENTFRKLEDPFENGAAKKYVFYVIDLKNRIINIDHQLQRIGSMEYHIESTKTNAGTRKLPMTEDVFRMFRAILEDRPTDFPEIMVDGYVGFLFRDKNGMPEVALHWEHRLKNAVNRYNSIFRVQLPKITPHICRHTYCSNQAKAGMNPKTLQYLMGHSDIGVTMNTYTHLSLDDAKNEMIRMEELEQARKEVDKAEDKKPMKQNMFKVV